MDKIKITSVNISDFQRETLSWTVHEIVESIKDHGYNKAYPIVLDDKDNLVDGGHRLQASLKCELTEVPFIRKSSTASNIQYALQCNDDRGRGRQDDVFDKAELCWKLSRAGMTGQQIAGELGFGSKDLVSKHSLIKDRLHTLAWDLARFLSTKNPNFVDSSPAPLVDSQSTIVDWKESHFRSLLTHLPLNGEGDKAIMRAQLQTIRTVLDRFANQGKKVTAKWIGQLSQTKAWQVKLAQYMRDNLASEVPLSDQRTLIMNIRDNVFGKIEDDKNLQKFTEAIAAINERILGVKLYQDNAFQRIPLFDDKSIALIVTDPPYNVTDHEWDTIGNDEQYLDWLSDWLKAIKPKLKDEYHLFFFISPTYQARVEQLLIDQDWPIKSRIIWSHRNLSQGRDITGKFITMWEMVFHCGTHPLNWPPEWNDERFEVQEWAAPQSNFSEDSDIGSKHHPTSKPVGLFELFIKVGSKPGDTILDTFAGGGTLGQAAKKIKHRRCILIEQNEDYCTVIEDRLGIKRSD